MLGKELRRLRNRYRNKTRGDEAKKEREGLICHGCNKRMNDNHPPLRHRASKHLDHYMCECGTVSHWLPAIVMVCVGYGRYRHVSQDGRTTCIGDFVPNRILPEDVLWLNPQTSTAYFFKQDMLVRLNLTALPRSHSGDYRFKPLAKGTNIVVNGEELTFDGITFVKTNPAVTDVGGLKVVTTYMNDSGTRSTEFQQ